MRTAPEARFHANRRRRFALFSPTFFKDLSHSALEECARKRDRKRWVASLFYPERARLGMFGGGGGMNPRKMQKMMEQMGIDMTDIDAEEVVIRTPDEELVFTDAEVQLMEAQGQKTYQVVGDPESRDRDDSTSSASSEEATDADSGGVDEDDVELVAMRAGVDEDTARAALEDNNGDLADAVDQLE